MNNTRLQMDEQDGASPYPYYTTTVDSNSYIVGAGLAPALFSTPHAHPLRIALTTCDDIFGAGGVGTSIVRIARGLSAHYNARVDILMLNTGQRAEFNPRGRNGIIQLDQRIDNV